MNHAETFRQLHKNPSVLRLANAWDAGSARIIETLGAPAIATTSAGVAWALGYADGYKLPVPELARVTANIARVIRVPLTVDVENGYTDEPGEVGGILTPIFQSGAVGINIEDGRKDPSLLAAKIGQIKTTAKKLAIDIFINARTDVYLHALVAEELRIEETITRAKLYRDAGADGIFVPGLTEPDAIRAIVQATGLPLNLLARPGLPDAAELSKLGVRRLSAGSAISAAACQTTADFAKAFLETGNSADVVKNNMPYGQLQGLFQER
jgi:2-methylisocitrate lyase-like PEP mutase family enzyme